MLLLSHSLTSLDYSGSWKVLRITSILHFNLLRPWVEVHCLSHGLILGWDPCHSVVAWLCWSRLVEGGWSSKHGTQLLGRVLSIVFGSRSWSWVLLLSIDQAVNSLEHSGCRSGLVYLHVICGIDSCSRCHSRVWSKGIRQLEIIKQSLNLWNTHFVVTSSNNLRVLYHLWCIHLSVSSLRVLSLGLDVNVLHGWEAGYLCITWGSLSLDLLLKSILCQLDLTLRLLWVWSFILILMGLGMLVLEATSLTIRFMVAFALSRSLLHQVVDFLLLWRHEVVLFINWTYWNSRTRRSWSCDSTTSLLALSNLFSSFLSGRATCQLMDKACSRPWAGLRIGSLVCSLESIDHKASTWTFLASVLRLHIDWLELLVEVSLLDMNKSLSTLGSLSLGCTRSILV